ncbi:major envelope protein [Selenomonas ruminantium subsp. lactilytica TAM6421]|uniref:Major envelope protein n=2 Tax=Selenomonas ruminantium TaxID=971 RepID=Q25BZ4_SELRU|nr:putative porin [Selenomonas ruminantium]BAE86853.1 major envelope protein [Selenomonas ruminantium]BAL84337.1 major envelope protein [Selenomonas ruminantium subsp. lactilytica TAM6421]
MKKTLVSALTTALVVGAASTTFAASNPFSDVPADHWAYDAVAQLAADGVVEGYGDSTFKGNRNITRYEMAQMVAKAMAKNTSGTDKALVDKLAAEFAEELNNLGVRVSNLERNADMVKWNGVAEYTFTRQRHEKNGKKTTNHGDDNVLFRLEPSAEVNSHWHVKARLDANSNLKSDQGEDSSSVKLKRVWAQGEYGKLTVKLGKFASLNDDTFADTPFSGAEVSYGKDVKVIAAAGRLNLWDASAFKKNVDIQNVRNWMVAGRHDDRTANYQYAGLELNKSKLSGGLYWHHLNAAGFDYKKGTTDEANIGAVKGSYTFSKNVSVNGFYTQNFDVDTKNYQDKSASLEVDYKGAQQENKGTWGAWVAYRRLGNAAIINNTYDVINTGYKGWEVGGNYTLFKNVVTTLRYGNQKDISNSNVKDQNFFGRVQFFF